MTATFSTQTTSPRSNRSAKRLARRSANTQTHFLQAYKRPFHGGWHAHPRALATRSGQALRPRRCSAPTRRTSSAIAASICGLADSSSSAASASGLVTVAAMPGSALITRHHWSVRRSEGTVRRCSSSRELTRAASPACSSKGAMRFSTRLELSKRAAHSAGHCRFTQPRPSPAHRCPQNQTLIGMSADK
jgi:hypothetical protein